MLQPFQHTAGLACEERPGRSSALLNKLAVLQKQKLQHALSDATDAGAKLQVAKTTLSQYDLFFLQSGLDALQLLSCMWYLVVPWRIGHVQV